MLMYPFVCNEIICTILFTLNKIFLVFQKQRFFISYEIRETFFNSKSSKLDRANIEKSKKLYSAVLRLSNSK